MLHQVKDSKINKKNCNCLNYQREMPCCFYNFHLFLFGATQSSTNNIFLKTIEHFGFSFQKKYSKIHYSFLVCDLLV